VSSCSGTTNAFTHPKSTEFFFEVPQQNLLKTLALFSGLFDEFLVSEAVVNKAIKAVDSEHDTNLRDISWRLRQFERSMYQEGHIYNHFNTGRLPEIGTDMERRVETILDLYMTRSWNLSVIGSEPVESLVQTVQDCFAGIKLGPVRTVDFKLSPSDEGLVLKEPFGPEQLGRQYHVQSSDIAPELRLLFPFPKDNRRTGSLTSVYVCHLINRVDSGGIITAAEDLVLGVKTHLEVLEGSVNLLHCRLQLTEQVRASMRPLQRRTR
jgi:secreted Zn-dependent insulinase-like peptidase